MNRKNILLIAQIGMLSALCLVFQALRAVIPSMPIPVLVNGQTLIIGSLVNLVLFVAVAITGLWGGVVIAIISPVMAFFQGHIGLPQLIPVVALGNLVLVLSYYYITNKRGIAGLTGVIAASIAKFAVLWASVYWVIGAFLPVIRQGLTTNAINILRNNLVLAFSWPQLVTALAGGLIALAIIPIIKKATKNIS